MNRRAYDRLLRYLGAHAVDSWCSWRRADRSLLNDAVTVLAACLMTVVAAGFGERLGEPGTPGLAGLAWPQGADQGKPGCSLGCFLRISPARSCTSRR
jgi:YwiC-like protein